MDANEEQQKKYFEMQIISQNLQQIDQQINIFEQKSAEMDMIKKGIEDLGKQKKGDEVLATLGGGIFFKAEILENSKFLVNIGKEISVKKSRKEVLELLNIQISEIKNYVTQMLSARDELTQRFLELQKELSSEK